ncbi:hypothetical protein [Paenibacillus mesophilus]|uniref:hypothetical protein n=1 Tax=Paenibacillus mesophilus TaxID=2582849 RepID=UPI0013054511|nr:hypothetical protein [Paenibacillus mesophilus]
MEQLYKPIIASNWSVLFKPEKTGCYVNDHTLVRDRDGSWHLHTGISDFTSM